MSGDAIKKIVSAQIAADLAALGASDIKGLPAAADIGRGVSDFHTACLTTLMSSDPSLGYAYLVGVDLGDLILRAYKQDLGKTADIRGPLGQLIAKEAPSIVRHIRELKQLFGDHVADPVAAGLADWAAWAQNGLQQDAKGAALSDVALRNLFYRQGSVWRTLLVGERMPTDYLQLRDYLTAALDMVSDYARVIRKVLAQPVTLAVLVVSVLIVIFVGLISRGPGANALATVVTLLSTFGVTGAGVTAVVKRLLDASEQVLWHAEVDAAIARAVNFIPTGVPRVATERMAKHSK